jgi:hypothetical protein
VCLQVFQVVRRIASGGLLLQSVVNNHLTAWAHQLLSMLWCAAWLLAGLQLSWPSHTAAQNTYSIVPTTQTGWQDSEVATRMGEGVDQVPKNDHYVHAVSLEHRGMSSSG